MPDKSVSSNSQKENTDGRVSVDGEKTVPARLILRSAKTGALGTLDKDSGHPYVSFATIATDIYGAPIFLTSDLALHTQNIRHDARISLMVNEPDKPNDPLTLGRTSLIGTANFDVSDAERQRYLHRNPEASGYAQFADFHFFTMNIEMVHYVGGFGRIYQIDPADFLATGQCSDDLGVSEQSIIEHMNADHADVIQLFATKLLGAKEANWQISGCDREGCDLVAEGQVLRLAFENSLESAENARKAFVELAVRARRD